jgi:hypothetical protein
MSGQRSGGARALTAIVVIVVALGALLVVADIVVRGIAQERFSEQIRSNLPEGVDGEVDVTIGGFSVIAQYLAGTMDRVELSAPELAVNGAPISVEVVGEGVPVDLASPVSSMSAVIEADQAAVNRLIAIPDVEGDVTFGEGVVGYADTIEVFGLRLDYSVTARPTAAGDIVLLQPESVQVDAGGGGIDVSGLADRVVGDDPIAVCVAQYLPSGVMVNGLEIAGGTATVRLEAQSIMLDEASLATTGSCD